MSRRRVYVDDLPYWLHRDGAVTTRSGTFLGRVEKASARGQRISRQPWKALGPGERYAGIHRTRADAIRALTVQPG